MFIFQETIGHAICRMPIITCHLRDTREFPPTQHRILVQMFYVCLRIIYKGVYSRRYFIEQKKNELLIMNLTHDQLL